MQLLLRLPTVQHIFSHTKAYSIKQITTHAFHNLME